MKVLAIAKRILLQLVHDRRTMALLLMAPLVLLTLISLLLSSFGTDQAIALVNGSVAYERQLEKNGVHVTRTTETEGLQLLEQREISAVVSLVNNRLQIQMDGSSSAAAQVLTKLEAARNTSGWIPADYKSDVTYIYGSAHLEMFDQLGPMLIGLLVFFLVFLIAGISFVQERTSGTLEKLLSTPVKRWEIVLGYITGFGIITVIQSLLISLYVVFVLKVLLAGSILLVLLTTLLAALTALTLGILLSTISQSEFQMVQMIPVVIVPQVFLSGIFELDGIWETLSYFTPIYYIADSLSKVMLRGCGFFNIAGNLLMLSGFCTFFVILNIQLLKKQRSI